MTDEQTTVRQLRDRMQAFVNERLWEKYHKPKNLASSIAIEAAELMEHFQWLDHKEIDALLQDETVTAEVADELADILAFVLSFANCLELDLSSAFERKMARNEAKYPPEEYRGHYERPKGSP